MVQCRICDENGVIKIDRSAYCVRHYIVVDNALHNKGVVATLSQGRGTLSKGDLMDAIEERIRAQER